ncbi:BTAD domain-containing putative transcriptional regulator [Streptomyces alfalfae]|uniref:AfsR/SARP family transcriptional regulator n=1 Tax=Streptomyces alfalfae TaxID=1642299 RepID=A0A7T4PCI4_9ACTN|nr:BTAD domain-containing putative transcriptional regulator [Streptomyces alfalfae]QQC87595.1 AfsR/SARP family transcriptional regulator [Streptomyces alfalfae]
MRMDVLGAVRAWHDDGSAIDLGGPRHREVLARLAAAEGRLVTADTLVADLWAEPGAGSLGALRTFVAALRRAVEPGRAPRTPPRLLVTEGPGYALRLPREAVDARRFEDALAADRRPPHDVTALGDALAAWCGPAYADFPDAPWAQRERARLEELRLQGVELRAGVLLDAGAGAELVAALREHVAEHPWREPAWGLLARALYRDGRRADALTTLRRARAMLVAQLGLDPGPELRRLESALLDGSASVEAWPRPWPGAGAPLGPRTTVSLARTLAIAGGDALVSARRDRLTAIRAAERTGDVALTARVIGAYDVPAIWSRSDDPEQSRAVVEEAGRTLAALGPDGPPGLRARLLATVAVESRSGDVSGTGGTTAAAAAREAEALARGLDDPALLAFALNGVFLQSFARPGLAGERDAVGAELVALAARHEVPTFGILGRLARLQSASALGRLTAGEAHAVAAEELAAAHESPLVAVLTAWFRARVLAARSAEPGGPSPAEAAAAYRAADASLAEAGMPGLHRGLLPLALLGLRLLHGRPAPTGPRLDWGPHLPWARPLVLLAGGDVDGARAALAAQPEPPRDHLQEALWCLTAHAAARLGEPEAAARAAAALRPARAEDAGGASGMLTLGPVRRYLDEAGAVGGS